ncbi:MAG: hypothetical protein ISQ65_02555 [Pseudomonadales bacterium]|nr:hypothetical protein [Pseudomonadales bacterium]
MATPVVPISWGELIDKLTILAIKNRQLTEPQALANVQRETELLQSIYELDCGNKDAIAPLVVELQQINQVLWDVEDALREKERDKIFDESFVQLARRVYQCNDQRARLKKLINVALGSELVEEKSYEPYE